MTLLYETAPREELVAQGSQLDHGTERGLALLEAIEQPNVRALMAKALGPAPNDPWARERSPPWSRRQSARGDRQADLGIPRPEQIGPATTKKLQAPAGIPRPRPLGRRHRLTRRPGPRHRPSRRATAGPGRMDYRTLGRRATMDRPQQSRRQNTNPDCTIPKELTTSTKTIN